MDDKWRTTSCASCGGNGVTWNPESWFGAVECNDCNQSGQVWIRPKGHAFAYPGGPAMGWYSEEDYKKGTPQMPYDWHCWIDTDEEVDKFIVDRSGSFDSDLNSVHCACGFVGTIKEHEEHAKQENLKFIQERNG